MRSDLICAISPAATKALKTLIAGLVVLASTICAAATGFWIPYTATPIPGTTGGKTGLFLIPSNTLESSPAPKFITTTPIQLLGLSLQYTSSGGAETYAPSLLMYAASDADGNTHVYGLALGNTATVPAPKQISSLVVPAIQEICSSNQAETDLAKPATLFVVLEVAATGKCAEGGGTFEVVSYGDTATTAPVVATITSNEFDSIYQNGMLEGMVLFDSATKALNFYKDNAFTAPKVLLSGVEDVLPIATTSINTGTEFGNSQVFIRVITASGTAEYRISPETAYAAVKFHTGIVGSSAVDSKNFYFADVTSATATKIYQEPLAGGTPKLLYSAPATGVAYQLFGTNGSVLAFQSYTLTSEADTVATLDTVPIGVTSTTPTKIASYKGIVTAFVASPTAADQAANILFADVITTSSSTPAKTTYTGLVIPLSDPAKQTQLSNAVYESFGILTNELTGYVWQVSGITDTNGGWGGGTVNQVDVSTLASTAFKTTGGSDYKMPAGYNGYLMGFSSDNIGLGTLFHENSSKFPKAATYGLAVDLGEDFALPIKIANTFVSAF